MHKVQDDLFTIMDYSNNNDNKFFFPTNRRNLLNIISSGILGPKEVYAKYRSDILEVSKGYIPLFKDGISEDIIDLTTVNKDVNYPVLIEVDANKIVLKALNGEIDESNEGYLDSFFMCESVLGFNAMDAIHFLSDEALQDFQSKGFENVPMDNYVFKVSPELFENDIEFKSSFFEKLNNLYTDDNKLIRKSLIADKVVSSIALLAKMMKRSDDVILLRALIEFDTIPKGTTVPYEYEILTDLIHSSVMGTEYSLKEETENMKLMELLLDILTETDPSEGWNPINVLDSLYERYIDSSGDVNEGIQKWYSYCKAVVRNEKEIDPKTFTDDHDRIKRGIFLFILRPEYQDVVDSEKSYLNPGYIVRTIALFLAGLRVGYERLSNDFKMPGKYHDIFSRLKAYIINKSIGREVDNVKIDIELDLNSKVSDKEYPCSLEILDKQLFDQSIQLPKNVNDIITQMLERNYEQTEYDIFDGRISYSFQYMESKRKQPIYIDVEKYTIRIFSPCVEFTKYSSYEKKYATNKVLAQMMKDNGQMKGKAYYVYEAGHSLSLERRIAISNIDNVDVIEIIEFVAKTADRFEEVYFKHDKVQ